MTQPKLIAELEELLKQLRDDSFTYPFRVGVAQAVTERLITLLKLEGVQP